MLLRDVQQVMLEAGLHAPPGYMGNNSLQIHDFSDCAKMASKLVPSCLWPITMPAHTCAALCLKGNKDVVPTCVRSVMSEVAPELTGPCCLAGAEPDLRA